MSPPSGRSKALTPGDCVTCVPFTNQIATLPLVSCQRMSLLPSPLKSPVSTIDQVVGADPRPTDIMNSAASISHTATAPLASRHRMSLLPSPLESPVPITDQVVG